MKHEDCLFCKIIDGEVPAAKVYEDDNVYAFMDISQVTDGHTLVVPKVHTTDIYDMDEHIASKIFATIPKIAKAIKVAKKPAGLNILNNNEIMAGQSVYHFHLHLIPRYNEKDGFNVKWVTRNDDFSIDELQEKADKIAKEIK